MTDKRPCQICRRWFEVDPRVGRKHRTCERPECRREQNRRACRRWRTNSPHQVEAYRVRRRVVADPAAPPELVRLAPMRHFDAEAVRHVIGVGGQVVLEELSKVILRAARHEMPPKGGGQSREVPKVPRSGSRHETAEGGAPS